MIEVDILLWYMERYHLKKGLSHVMHQKEVKFTCLLLRASSCWTPVSFILPAAPKTRLPRRIARQANAQAKTLARATSSTILRHM